MNCVDNCYVDTHANILFDFLFHFLFHFQLLHFLFLFFLFNNSISFYFCAVSTTAMLTLVPIFSGVVVCTQVLYSDCDSVHSLYREWSQWRPLQMAVNGWTKKVWQTHPLTHPPTNPPTHTSSIIYRLHVKDESSGFKIKGVMVISIHHGKTKSQCHKVLRHAGAELCQAQAS